MTTKISADNLKADIAITTTGDIDVSSGTLTLANDQISGDKISGGTISTFTSTGIDDNATSTAITIDSNENVGIRTTSPQARLHVYDFSGSGGFRITRSDNITGVGMHLTSDSLNNNFLSYGDLRFRVSATGTGTDASERMRITTAGNVGIGTSSPDFSGFGSSTSGIQITATGNNATSKLSGNTAGDFYRVTGSGQHWLYGKGAVPMTFSTDSSERMRIDSSGNILVGKTSSSAFTDGVTLSGGGGFFSYTNDRPVIINRNGSDGSLIEFYKDGSSSLNLRTISNGLEFSSGSTGYLNILSNGNVGINQTSPTEKLHVTGNVRANNFTNRTSIAGVDPTPTDANDFELGAGYLNLSRDDTAEVNQIQFGKNGTLAAAFSTGANYLAIKTNGDNERMRIDSSGNLLVGTTNSAPASNNVTGVVFSPSQASHFSTDGTESLRINRKTSDGQLISLRKDASEVGSIGAYAGRLNIGTGDTGINFNPTVDSIFPFNVSTGANGPDNTVNLGTSGFRFKDLYLGGGLYVGGGGTANKLDDYEEGSFTAELSSTGATFTYTVRQGWYVKVGNRVMFNIYIQLDGTPFTTTSNDTRITGLPFTSGNLSGNDNRMICGTRVVSFSSGQTFLMGNIGPNANTVYLIQGGSGSSGVPLPSNALSNASGQIFLSGSYQTA